MRDVLAQDGQQVSRVVDQPAVQALAACGAYPPFRISIRSRRLRWTAEYFDATVVNTASKEVVYFVILGGSSSGVYAGRQAAGLLR